MGRTVDELLDGMSSVEWQRWLEFRETNPIGDDRADLRAAQICSTLVQVHGGKAKPSDFMPEFGPKPEREPMTDDAMLDQAKKITAMLGGKIKKRSEVTSGQHDCQPQRPPDGVNESV